MENQTSDLKKAIEELLKGRELGNQLFELVHHQGSISNNGDEAGSLLIRPFAEDLVKNILRSFTNALLLLSTDCDSDAVSLRDSSSDLVQSCKNFSIRNRRGCYKRKRTTQTWEKDSPIFLVDDGYAWRKYGQKMTMNAKYLRNYYRCSHKYDEGCPAIKQVQRIQENPPLYRTTYYGLHTCKNLEMSLDPSSPTDSSILLSFNNTSIPSKEDHPFLSSSTKKHEENQMIHMGMEQNQYEVSLDSSRHVTVLSSTLDEDVISSVKIESFGVDDVLLRCFDFDDFVRFGL